MPSRILGAVALLGAIAIGLFAGSILLILFENEELSEGEFFAIWFELPLGVAVSGLAGDEIRWVRALCAGAAVASLLSAASALRSIVWGASARVPLLALAAAVACCAALALFGQVR